MVGFVPLRLIDKRSLESLELAPIEIPILKLLRIWEGEYDIWYFQQRRGGGEHKRSLVRYSKASRRVRRLTGMEGENIVRGVEKMAIWPKCGRGWNPDRGRRSTQS